ncbi:hypothetical protein BT63DRAFT_99567 [Microthyrium microscopicum]|uniref:Ubiquitin-like domain-containing protein n=1 Tax=Microthyrium microscopicum TaxID=703497 RepID=A0A6A6TY17_9PEZI|nr:hypothetical protein BT63DRAFT_99567 [Microthyrium microscopicum]
MASLPPDIHELIIRFASSIPDLPLALPNTQTLSVLSLKLLIRSHLPVGQKNARLNLIFAGKLLRNHDPLSAALSPSTRQSIKGKTPIYPRGPGPPLYVQCSLGENLTSEQLAAEAGEAAALEASLRASLPTLHLDNERDDEVLERPRGFDRLLATGWDAADVATLRASFLAHLSHTHTPDNMPLGDTLRALEERWLDSTGPAGVDGGDGEGMGFEEDEAGALDDQLWGTMLGFFWPWAAWWGTREEGVWTERRQVMVMAGLVMNILFGFLRMFTTREESL